MNGLVEVTATGLIPNSSSKALKTVVVNSMGATAAVVEIWDTPTTDADGLAKRKATVQAPANSTQWVQFAGGNISMGLYIKIVSGTTPRVSYELAGG